MYLALLGQVVARQRWRCLAYCLMTTTSTSSWRRRIRTSALACSVCTGLCAGVQQAAQAQRAICSRGGIGAVVVRTDEQLLTVARYIVLNPVEAGMCDGPADWAWAAMPPCAASRRPRGSMWRGFWRTSARAAVTRARATRSRRQMIRSSRVSSRTRWRRGGDVGARRLAGVARERRLERVLVVEVELRDRVVGQVRVVLLDRRSRGTRAGPAARCPSARAPRAPTSRNSSSERSSRRLISENTLSTTQPPWIPVPAGPSRA